MELTYNQVITGDALKKLKKLLSQSVNTIITSPPYFNLRDYKMEGQIGLEATTREYILKLVEIFTEAKRVLKNDGTLWLIISDTYASRQKDRQPKHAMSKGRLAGGQRSQMANLKQNNTVIEGYKTKDLMCIPWRVAMALREPHYTCKECGHHSHSMQWGYWPEKGTPICPFCMAPNGNIVIHKGWYLRQDIIWEKTNCMPESVTDRCTKSHEYMFMFSKSKFYYFDQKAIKQPIKVATQPRLNLDVLKQNNLVEPEKLLQAASLVMDTVAPIPTNKRKSGNLKRKNGVDRGCPENNGSNVCGNIPWEGEMSNKRSVWSVPTEKYDGNHNATFPEKLIVDCVKAGSPVGGVVLDCFGGSGKTAIVAAKLKRRYVLIELNPQTVTEAKTNIEKEVGLLFE